MSVRSCWFIVLFKSYVSILIFSLVVLTIIEIGILQFPTNIVELSIFPFVSVSFNFMCFEALLLFACIIVIEHRTIAYDMLKHI